jgi:uncharacterized membrane protein
MSKSSKKERTYRYWKMSIAFLISAFTAFALAIDQPIAAVIVIAVGAVLIWMVRMRYREVERAMADERMNAISSRAANVAFRVFAIGALALMMAELVLEFMGLSIPGMQGFAYTLGYLVSALVFLHYLFYLYYSTRM